MALCSLVGLGSDLLFDIFTDFPSISLVMSLALLRRNRNRQAAKWPLLPSTSRSITEIKVDSCPTSSETPSVLNGELSERSSDVRRQLILLLTFAADSLVPSPPSTPYTSPRVPEASKGLPQCLIPTLLPPPQPPIPNQWLFLPAPTKQSTEITEHALEEQGRVHQSN